MYTQNNDNLLQLILAAKLGRPLMEESTSEDAHKHLKKYHEHKIVGDMAEYAGDEESQFKHWSIADKHLKSAHNIVKNHLGLPNHEVDSHFASMKQAAEAEVPPHPLKQDRNWSR